MSDDDDLLADLARVLGRVDPPPDHVREAAAAAIELRSLDAELAALLDDADELVDAGVRSGAAVAEPLVFEVDDVIVEVEVDDGQLHVQVAPAESITIAVRAGRSVSEVTTDDLGRVSVVMPSDRPVRLELTVGDRQVVTDWFLV